MDIYSLYKLGRWGWIHTTSMKFSELNEAKYYFKNVFGYNEVRVGELGSWKIEVYCCHDYAFIDYKNDIVCKKCNISKYLS